MAFTLKIGNKLMIETTRRTRESLLFVMGEYAEKLIADGKAKIVEVRLVETKRRK